MSLNSFKKFNSNNSNVNLKIIINGCIKSPLSRSRSHYFINQKWKIFPIRKFSSQDLSLKKYKEAAANSARSVQSNKSGLKSIFLLIIPVATFGLGIWQVKRWRWKLKLIEEMEANVATSPLEFPIMMEELKNLEYKKVKIQGKFDCSKEIVMGPRSLIPIKGDVASRGLISASSPNTSGYHIITPFKLSDRDMTILVNRGWIPSKKREGYEENDKEKEIIGVVRLNEKRAPFVGKNIATENGLWLTRDLPVMAKTLGTSEVFLDLVSVLGDNKSNHAPVPGQTRVTLRNDHVSYFFTWFSLSGITGYMWHRIFVLKKPLR